MENEIKIRKGSIEDAEQILEVQKAAFFGQGQIYQNFAIRPLTETVEALKDEFEAKTFLVLVLGGRVIGSVRFWALDGVVQVERISILPEHQNRGLGSKLLLAVENECPQAGAFELFTGTKSVRNIHIYQKLGYRVRETKEDGQGILTLYMLKEAKQELPAEK